MYLRNYITYQHTLLQQLLGKVSDCRLDPEIMAGGQVEDSYNILLLLLSHVLDTRPRHINQPE